MQHTRGMHSTGIEWLTRMRPVVVCPEISSPAQSFASVTHPTSGLGSSGLRPPSLTKVSFSRLPIPPPWPWQLLAAFCWQTNQLSILQLRTSRRPVKNVIRLEHRNAYQWRSRRQSSAEPEVRLDTSENSCSDRLEMARSTFDPILHLITSKAQLLRHKAINRSQNQNHPLYVSAF